MRNMPRRTDPELKVRFPGDLKNRLARSAEKNSRSLNSEIVQLLEDALRRSTTSAGSKISDQETRELIVEMHKLLMSWDKSAVKPAQEGTLSLLPELKPAAGGEN